MSIRTDDLGFVFYEADEQEEKELENSYNHLCKLRDEVIAMGIIPPIDKWHDLNPNIK